MTKYIVKHFGFLDANLKILRARFFSPCLDSFFIFELLNLRNVAIFKFF